MEKSQEIAVTQLRKSIETLSSSSTEKYGDETLMRFLIARSMDPEKAAKMFVHWQKWRVSFVPNGFISESEIEDELGSRKAFLQGFSVEGFPVFIIKLKLHIPSKDHLQFKKYVVHLLDKIIASSFKGREIGNEKLIAIVDLQHISYKNIDTRGFIAGFQCLQAYYPERLAKLYFLHMPRFFVGVWKMISRFLEKATLEKIMIVHNEEDRKNLTKEIGEEILPEEYGGRGKLVVFQDVIVPQNEPMICSKGGC
ncbi:CRAL-TRIO domain-containing protein YKL091C-like [Mercurialis annua]|uniref:CRAL-TRIO domain-containing protein YKL091C-like n=1 Tax=Mercurialis annua TaxID=3986 RepID=UPI00215ED30D|nr:CRAL-TRIO domain-containing protein YKL091C-like [Mercurialis annua]